MSISGTISADVSKSPQRPRNRPPEGRRFVKGVSGCPGGAHGTRKRLLSVFEAELGALSAADHALLVRAVAQLCEADRRTITAAERRGALNSGNRIIEQLRERQRRKTVLSFDT